MGNIQSSKPGINFFANMLDADSHFLEGSLQILGTPLGLLSGHLPDFKAIGRDYENYGLETANAFTGKHRYVSDSGSPALSQAQAMAQNVIQLQQDASDPKSILNARNSGGMVSNIYSQAGSPNTGANMGAPPSATAQIASPAVKMTMASLRGNQRGAMNTRMKLNDFNSLHPASTAPPSNNQAGGTSVPATSSEPSTGQPQNSLPT